MALFKCHCTLCIYGPLVKKGSYRFFERWCINKIIKQNTSNLRFLLFLASSVASILNTVIMVSDNGMWAYYRMCINKVIHLVPSNHLPICLSTLELSFLNCVVLIFCTSVDCDQCWAGIIGQGHGSRSNSEKMVFFIITFFFIFWLNLCSMSKFQVKVK